MNIEEREDKFRKEVQEIGGLLYKKSTLDEFTDFWCEPDRGAKPKLKMEKQKTWKTSLRLKTWARNCTERGKNPYLSDSEKTVEQKKRDFIVQLRPYLDKYGKSTLNSFYSWWGETDGNKNLRFEGESHWELSSRLERWFQREQERNKQKVF